MQRRYPVQAGVKLYERKDTEGQTETFKSFRWLTVWHIVAAVIHALSFAAIFITFLVTKTKFDAYLTSDVLNITTGDVTTKQVSKYDLTWVLTFMPLITSLFHVYQGYMTGQYKTFGDFMGKWYTDDVQRGVNLVRWIEYSITATLMTWIITQLSGITNIFLVFLLAVVGNVVLQWHGYFFELNMGRLKWIERWSPMISGFVLFVGQWSILACYFIRSVNANDGAPWFVWVSFFGLLGTFLLFPLIQILYVNNVWVMKDSKIRDWYYYEFWFIVLSLFSKLLLDWTLFSALITERS